jgi:hypothetical protein
MERDGLLVRQVHNSGSRHVEYRLTPTGTSLGQGECKRARPGPPTLRPLAEDEGIKFRGSKPYYFENTVTHAELPKILLTRNLGVSSVTPKARRDPRSREDEFEGLTMQREIEVLTPTRSTSIKRRIERGVACFR